MPIGISIVHNKTINQVLWQIKRAVLIYNNDEKVLSNIQSGPIEHDFDVQVLNSPHELIENAERYHAGVVIVNPGLTGIARGIKNCFIGSTFNCIINSMHKRISPFSDNNHLYFTNIKLKYTSII